jgi:hypothetical protein
MANTQGFQPTSKSEPCFICGNVSGHCKSTIGDRGDALRYCHNNAANPVGPIDGHKFLKSAGEWGIFVLPDSEPRQTQPRLAPQKAVSKSVAPDVRDAEFRSFMAGKTLHPDDRADLHRRGITDDQIAAWGIVSIEGKEPGYLCPCVTPDGFTVGAQWRLRNPAGGARYKWVSWIGGGSKNGEELPLTVHRPIGVEPVGIAVCEGIGAKSFILAQYTGMVAIGAGSDSQFISSPDHWREYLAALSSELDTTIVTMYPDSGAARNASVMGKYRQWFKFVADLGYEVQIAWWGQTVKGESPDPDELTAAVDVKLISVADFEAMADPEVIPLRTLWKCLSSHLDQIGSWKTQDLGKNAFEIAKVAELIEEMKVNPNIKYIGTRTAQANGSQEAHDLHTFSVFEPQMNCNFTVSKILEDKSGGGIELEATWFDRMVCTRRALIKTSETLTTKDFMIAFTRELGTHFTSTLKINELAAIIENRKGQYLRDGGKVYRLADRTGQQDDGTWVFEDAQFKPDGTLTTEQETLWMFNRSLGELEKVPSPTIAPQNPEALGNLARAVEGFFHAGTVPLAWFVCGYTTATMQRQTVMKQDHAFPQLNVFGDAGGGKTTAAKVGASLIGMHGDRSIITRFSESLIYEQVKSLGGVPLILDDPVKKGMKQESRDAVDNFLWSMYNGVSRRVRGNEQTPNTNVIVTSNVALGEGSQAIESRLLKMHFPVRPVNEAGFPALEKAMGEATGGLSQLLAIQYGREAVREIRSRLLEHLTGSHSRISLSMALLVYFTQKFCDVAGVNFDAFDYAVKHLCPTANDFESDKDSLTDFLEKLAIMRSEGLVGEWNLVQDKAGDLAIHLPGIWGGFQSRFNPNYSQQSLEQLIEGRGGAKGAVRRFVGTKQECVDYRKAVNVWEMQASEARGPAAPKKTENRKSIIVPRTIAAAAGFSSDCGESDENLPTIDAPAPTNDPTLESLAKPPGMGRIIPQPTTPVVFTSPLPVGTWEADGPDPWAESDLDDARISIQNNPTAEDNFKPLIPRSQWKQVGIKEDERCAA